MIDHLGGTCRGIVVEPESRRHGAFLDGVIRGTEGATPRRRIAGQRLALFRAGGSRLEHHGIGSNVAVHIGRHAAQRLGVGVRALPRNLGVGAAIAGGHGEIELGLLTRDGLFHRGIRLDDAAGHAAHVEG